MWFTIQQLICMCVCVCLFESRCHRQNKRDKLIKSWRYLISFLATTVLVCSTCCLKMSGCHMPLTSCRWLVNVRRTCSMSKTLHASICKQTILRLNPFEGDRNVPCMIRKRVFIKNTRSLVEVITSKRLRHQEQPFLR